MPPANGGRMEIKMAQLLYVCVDDINRQEFGVVKKILAQKYAFEKMGLDVIIAGFTEDGVYIQEPNGRRITRLLSIIRNSRLKRFRRILLTNLIREYYIDYNFKYFYLRYVTFTKNYIDLLRFLKNHNVINILEIPTYPIPQSSIKIAIEKFNRASSVPANYIDRLIYIGNKTERIYGLKAIQIPNGIPGTPPQFYHRIKTVHTSELHLITVAWIHKGQGYDRIIDSLRRYYNSAGNHKYKIILNIVGDGPAKEQYEKMVKDFHLSEYINFWGYKKGNELTELYNDADIAIAGLGGMEDSLKTASKLKVKEYFQYGIPFIYAVPEIDVPLNYKYALKVPNDLSEKIDIHSIVDFGEMIINSNQLDIENEMHKFAREHFLWESILRKNLGDLIDC